jgi:FkbM family methyltransferase
MKAIRWHDLSPKPLRTLAVEIGQTNFDVLHANVRLNGLEGAIVPVHAGLWSESGEGVQKHSFSTRRFLATTDRWEDHMQHEEKVRLLTIPDLLSENEVEVADFVNIQVNGAEIEVLNGMHTGLDRVKVVSVAAYYSQDGRKNADVVRDMLRAWNCIIIHETPLGRITAATPKFRDEILALKTPPSRKGGVSATKH